MLFFFGTSPFTNFHVALSLVGIVSGFVVVYGLLTAKRLSGWTGLFLVTTVATSATGFFLPAKGFMPSHGVGILSLLALALAMAARYYFHLAGAWRWLYVAGAVIAQYFDVFVLVIQSFLKVPALKALYATQEPSGPAFAIVQIVVLAAFVVVGILAVKKFHVGPGVAELAT